MSLKFKRKSCLAAHSYFLYHLNLRWPSLLSRQRLFSSISRPEYFPAKSQFFMYTNPEMLTIRNFKGSVAVKDTADSDMREIFLVCVWPRAACLCLQPSLSTVPSGVLSKSVCVSMCVTIHGSTPVNIGFKRSGRSIRP